MTKAEGAGETSANKELGFEPHNFSGFEPI